MSFQAFAFKTAEVLVRSTVNDKEVEMRLFFQWNRRGGITQPALDNIVNRVRASFSNNFFNVLGGPFLFREVHAFSRDPDTPLSSTIVVDLEKGFLGEISPNNIALRIKNLDDREFNRHPSSNFIYAIPESRITDGVIESSYANDLLALWTTNQQSHGPFGWWHVMLQQEIHGTTPTFAEVRRVTHYALGSYNPAAQRRRLAGRPS